MRLSHSVTRRVVGGSTINQPTQELREIQTAGSRPLLQRAVVVEVIDDPASLTEERKQSLADSVDNPAYVDVMPANSILARLVNDSADLGNPTATILFPFFSSYIMLPLVPGEHVSVVYDDPSRAGTVVGYWLARTSEQRTVEDINYNVSDRRFDPGHNPQLLSTNDRRQQSSSDEEQQTLGFPNGGGTGSTLTLRITGSNGQNPYDGIVQESSAIKNFTFEPVPRFNKRPGEFVIQGKNNATIVLGEDRTGAVVRSEADAIGQAGSIDLVAGRGRTLPTEDTEDPQDTAPRVTTNSRNQREVNKVPYLNEGRRDNPREGDPHFATDAARVLITMQSEADKNFGIVDLDFPDDTLAPVQPNEGTAGTLGKSYVVAKADHVRLIARKNDDVEGTVLVVREGTGEGDLAYLYIDASGKMQVYAPEIYLGKATGKAEPYIKWSEFKKTVQGLQEQINALEEFCNGLVQELQTAFAGAVAVPYSPITTLTQAVPLITTKKTTLGTQLSGPNSDTTNAVENSKSERLFGE